MPASPHIELPLALIHHGKVRDIYDIDKKNMLIVASDRLDEFDFIVYKHILNKWKIVTCIAN